MNIDFDKLEEDMAYKDMSPEEKSNFVFKLIVFSTVMDFVVGALFVGGITLIGVSCYRLVVGVWP